MIGIAEALRALAEFLGIVSKRQELNNTPEMIAAKKAQDEVNARNRIERAVEQEDENTIRQELAE
jgi:hypothetical protein